jgi:hypothetical protein
MDVDAKILNRVLASQIQQQIKRIIYHDTSGIYSRNAKLVQWHKSINVIVHINRMRDKTHHFKRCRQKY